MSSNTSGKIFNYTTWGESHGKAIGCVVDGVPSKIPLSEKDIQIYLNKRKGPFSKSSRTPHRVKQELETTNPQKTKG